MCQVVSNPQHLHVDQHHLPCFFLLVLRSDALSLRTRRCRFAGRGPAGEGAEGRHLPEGAHVGRGEPDRHSILLSWRPDGGAAHVRELHQQITVTLFSGRTKPHC